MAQNRQWILLDEVIKDYLNEAELSMAKYFKIFHIAYRGLEKMGLDMSFVVKSIKLPVNSNLTVTLPADYLNYSKVGVLNQQGEIIPMGVNSNLTTAFDLQPTRLEQTQDDTIATQLNDFGVTWYGYWNGSSFGTTYGLPSGTPTVGSYKIDNANGVIVLSQDFSYEYVMLEYVSMPKAEGDYYLPIQFREALIAWIRWKDNISVAVKTRPQQASVESKRRDYFNERRLALASYDPIRLPDLYDWHLKTQREAVKA